MSFAKMCLSGEGHSTNKDFFLTYMPLRSLLRPRHGDREGIRYLPLISQVVQKQSKSLLQCAKYFNVCHCVVHTWKLSRLNVLLLLMFCISRSEPENNFPISVSVNKAKTKEINLKSLSWPTHPKKSGLRYSKHFCFI